MLILIYFGAIFVLKYIISYHGTSLLFIVDVLMSPTEWGPCSADYVWFHGKLNQTETIFPTIFLSIKRDNSVTSCCIVLMFKSPKICWQTKEMLIFPRVALLSPKMTWARGNTDSELLGTWYEKGQEEVILMLLYSMLFCFNSFSPSTALTTLPSKPGSVQQSHTQTHACTSS